MLSATSARTGRRSRRGTRPAGGPARACRRACAAPSARSCSPRSAARRARRRSPWPRSAAAAGTSTRSAGTWSSRPRRRSYGRDRTESDSSLDHAQRRDPLVQRRDELARVLEDEVGAEARARSGSSAPSRTGRRRRCTGADRAPPAHAITSTTPSRTPAVAVESATTSGCSDSTSRAMSCAGAPGAEQEHLPAVGLQEVGHHPQAERVQLLRRPRDDREPPVLRRPLQLPRQAVEDRLGDRGGVVLLGDVERAHRPAVPDLAQRGLEHSR